MSKYESDTKYIFVNTENLETRDGGDQMNRFKINLGSNPINSDDNSLIKISLTQFDMAKNFHNVNDTNNTLRLYQGGFTQGNFTIGGIDTMIKIDVGDYVSFEAILLNLCAKIKAEYDAVKNGGTSVNVTTDFASTNTTQAETYSGFYQLDEDSNLTTPNSYNLEGRNTGLYFIKITFTRDDGSNFVAASNSGDVPYLACLHIPPSSGTFILSGGEELTANEQYNDSYILLGIPRETNINTRYTPNTGDSFIALAKAPSVTNAWGLFNTYPVNQGLHTCSNVYLRANLNTSLATVNHENLAHNHQGNIAQSHILGKIPRVSNNEGDRSREIVEFRANDIQSQSMVVTQNMIHEITFSITDNKGRVIPATPALVRLFSLTAGDFPATNPKQNRLGNLFADFTLKVERLSIPFAPNVLQGTPDIKRVSVNQVSNSVPLKNNGCGF